MATNPPIYHGFWTRHSEGPILGATLTLSTQGGFYLVAFLAVFVGLAGTSSWQILSYLFFRTRLDKSTPQQLAILRNISSDLRALWEFMALDWNVRKTKPSAYEARSRSYGRTPIVLIAAALHAIAFLVAGVFISRVTTAKSGVLLQPSLCGHWTYDHLSTTEWNNSEALQFDAMTMYTAEKSTRLASQCYNGSTPLTEDCDMYGPRLLHWTRSISRGPCPFDPSMCIHDTVVTLDSGYVNSLDDLGINSHSADAVSFRKVIECAPIKTKGFTKTYNAGNLTDDITKLIYSAYQSPHGNEFTAFYYGSNAEYGTEATFVFNNGSFDMSMVSSAVPYRVSTVTDFEAIPQLRAREVDARTTLFFLANTALYPSPVTDPWFNAQTPMNNTLVDGPEIMYQAQQPVSVLGCNEQLEVCNPALTGSNTDSCISISPIGPMTHSNDTDYRKRLQLNSRQVGILDRFDAAIDSSLGLGCDRVDCGLLASQLASLWASPALPDDQWIVELEHWFPSLLIYTQLRVFSYVAGYDITAWNQWKLQPSANNQWMCNSQMVQHNDITSFSVLGLAIILSLGGALMLVNFSLHSVWSRLRQNNVSKHRNEHWESAELLELASNNRRNHVQAQGDEKHKTAIASVVTASTDSVFESQSRSSHSHSFVHSVDAQQYSPTHHRQPSAATTVDVDLEQDDFPPQELARLISDRSAAGIHLDHESV